MALYDAFISYSHARDKPIAAALHSAVQTLGKPWYRRRALRVFRDDASLSATPSLWPSIERALSESRYLILLASPEAAKSPWVSKELTYWLDHKSADTLLLALTDGELVWDNALNDFARREGTPLPTVLTGRFIAEPKWVDLTAYRDGAGKRDAKFTELAADFAATIRGIPKEDLLSQEVRQQRQALTLAWSAAVGLLALSVVAVWQWTRAIEQTNTANAQRALAESERNRAEQQRLRAETAQVEAESERDKAQQALLVAAARQSLLLTSDHRPEQAWTTLTDALDVTKSEKSPTFPALLYEAGLTSLIEDRHGPEFSFKLSDHSLTATENSDSSLRLSPSVIATFDVEGDRVAVAKYFDVRIWSTANGAELAHFELPHHVSGVSFNERGDVLIVNGSDEKKSGLLTLVDLSSKAKRTFELKTCFGLIDCIASAPGANTKLVNIQKFGNLAGLILSDAAPPTLFVPPIKPNVMRERYYTFLKEPEREGEPNLIAIYDLATNATMRFPFKGKDYEQLSVAKDQPLLVVYSSFGPKFDLYRFDINARNPARSNLRFVKQLIARDSVATKDVALSEDGRLLYYSNWGGGASGGGRGALIAAVIDVETGREIWSTAFDGDTRFGPGQQFIARTFEQISGEVRTSFADGRTQQEKFAVDGVPIEFDPTGRMVLMEERQKEPNSAEKALALRRTPTRLVLTELSHIAAFAHESRWPRGLRDICDLSGRRFKTLSDRIARQWNAFDWRPTMPHAVTGKALAAIEGRRELLRFLWDTEGTIEVIRDEKAVARGPLQEITKLYPHFAELIEPRIAIQAAEFTSPDGQWLALLHQAISPAPSPIHWRIFRLDGNEHQLFKSGTMEDVDLDSVGDLFLASAPLAVIHVSPCSLSFINLTDGSIAGQIRPAFSRGIRVKQITDDMLAVYSYDAYSEAQSVQLLSYPELHEGPWLILWEDYGMKAIGVEATVNPLVRLKGEIEIADEGKTLLVRPQDGPPTALAVPPWGKRLRDLLVSKRRRSPSPN